jgi:hypothetical protein
MLCHPKPAKQKELPELPVGKWACRKPDCRQMFPTRNKLFAHLQEQLYFSKSIVPIYQVAQGVGPEIVSESHTSTLYTVAKIIMPAVRKKEKVIMELVRSYVLAFPECTRKRKVIKSGMRGRGRNRRMHYLVRWKGYMDQSSTNGHQLKKWSMWTT